MSNVELDVTAAEVMWDAILASVPVQPAVPLSPSLRANGGDLQRFVGVYSFSPFVSVKISQAGGKLLAKAVGERSAYAIGKAEPTELESLTPTTFSARGRYPTLLNFAAAGELIVNPGHWQQVGRRAAP
jgi:hypothetical protein